MNPPVHRIYGRLPRTEAEPADTATPCELDEWYEVERPTPPGRPWVALNMITSIDGSVAFGGSSGELGNLNDRQVLVTLRRTASAVLVGAGTAAAEGYGPPRQPGLRIAVVSNSAEIDATAALFTSGAGLLITHAQAEVPPGVECIRAGDARVDLGAALAELGRRLPASSWVVAEGGPSLNGALLDDDLIDEINVTTAPMLVGGAAARLTSGAHELPRRFRLAHQLVDDDDYVFSRWVRRDEHRSRPS